MRSNENARHERGVRHVFAGALALALTLAAPLAAGADDTVVAPAAVTQDTTAQDTTADHTTDDLTDAVREAVPAVSAAHAPAEQLPVEEATASDAPAENAPAEDSPATGEPASDVPAAIEPTSAAQAKSVATLADGPMPFGPEMLKPIAVDDHYTVVAGEPFLVPAPGVLGNDTPVPSHELSYAQILGGQPSWMSNGANGGFTITAPLGGPSSYEVQYQAVPWSGEPSEPATITVTVLPPGSPVNQAPIAADETFQAPRNQVFTTGAPGVLANDSDPDGDPLTVKYVSSYSEGPLTLAADGTLRWPLLYAHGGSAWVKYLVCDAELCTGASATIQVGPEIDDPNRPTAVTDVFSAVSGSSVSLGAPGPLGNDVSPSDKPLILVELDDPNHGSVTFWASTGEFVYFPDAGFTGLDSFSYVVSDGTLLDEGNIEMTVTACEGGCEQNTAPEANVDLASAGAGQTTTFDAPGVLGNDTDVDGDVLTVVSHTQPAHGSITIAADGGFTYVADADYTGAVDVTYTISDGHAQSSANLRIEVHVADPVIDEDCPITAPAGFCDETVEDPEDPQSPPAPAAGSNEISGVPGPREEQLAVTGADSASAAALALGLLALGTALTLVRRRRRA